MVPDACLERVTEYTCGTAGCMGLEAAVLGFAVTAQSTAAIAPACAVGQPSGGLGISWGLHFT